MLHETQFDGATIRMDTDPYTATAYPTILKLPGVIDVRSIVTLSESKYTTAIPLRARKFR